MLLISLLSVAQQKTTIKANVPLLEDKPKAKVPLLTDMDDLLEIKSNEPDPNDLLDIKVPVVKPAVPNAGQQVGKEIGLNGSFTFNKKIGFSVASPEGNMVSYFYLNTKNGVLRFLWQEGITGVTLKDNTTLFSIYYKIIGKPGAKSPISFVNIATSPTLEREIVDTTFATVNTEYQDGLVLIKPQTSTSVFANNPDKFRVTKAYPNPFRTQLTLEFSLIEAGSVDLEVVDVLGRIVHTEQRSFLAGKQELLLPESVFPSPGNYFVRMYQGTSFTLQPVIFME
jgi:hypothetical protein